MNRFLKDLVGIVEQATIERVAGYLGLVVRDEVGLIKYLIDPSMHIDVHHDDSHDDIKTKLLNAIYEDMPLNGKEEKR